MVDLLVATLLGTLQICAGLFGGWLLFFVLADAVDMAPLVGMYYIAWPIAFPLLSALPIAVVLALLLVRTGPPYTAALRRPRFLWGVLLPIGIVAFAVMLLTCPLETGGTLLDRLLGASG
ncbi:MAG: hypothetical protein GWP66_13210 [Gammaproteobacteria bacterium]|jgi:hypothetical protein|nr:hypothetical protein [Gammaproteobacteria bacterium]